MSDRTRRLGGLALIAGLCALPARAADGGGVVGWVEDAKGAPVAGAIVSLFGKGLQGGGFVTLSDSAGRFYLSQLPAGAYTLRALGGDRAATRRITVLPNQDSLFTLSFGAPQVPDAEAALEKGTEPERELRWLLRHKPRSVLENTDEPKLRRADATPRPGKLLESLVPGLGADLEFTTSSEVLGAGGSTLDVPTPSLSAVRLKGRVANLGRWSVGGLVTDMAASTWRTAGEFVLQPSLGHEIQMGAGYGTRSLRAALGSANEGHLDNRSVGAFFVHDRFPVTERLSASVGARLTYIGFVADRTQISPTASLEYKVGSATKLRASSTGRTVAPGGDLLTLSTLATAPAMAIALLGEDVRAESVRRYDVAGEQALGATTFTGFLFREGVSDTLVNVVSGPIAQRTLRITNSGSAVIHGGGFSVARRFGDVLTGSVTYTAGRARGRAVLDRTGAFPASTADGGFQDVVGRVETFVDASGTRIVAYYRLNSWSGQRETRAQFNSRFDVQLTQQLPFLRAMTRTEWELLLAFRNLFYETTEGGLLDEIAVVNPPKRLVGGISVRF